MNRFSVIGAGYVGLNLIRSLQKNGYVLKHVFQKAKGGYFASRLTHDMAELVGAADFVFIAVQESKIKAVAQAVAVQAAPRGKIFFHASNSLTSDELLPLRRAGAHVASFSPLQTFIGFRKNEDLFSGITFLLEGDKAAMTLARRIAADLQARVLPVRKVDKMYFHMAAIAAANFFIADMKFAEGRLRQTSGRPGLEILFPLVEQVLRNVKKIGWRDSLSGPLKRGETGLLAKHESLLAGNEKKIYHLLLKYLQENSGT
jgi:predicted short-subunit dehydrogenase-like oxidoreductase (DUF2520 family)